MKQSIKVMRMSLVCSFFMTVAGAATHDKVIYGDDSRREFFEVAKDPSWHAIADSSVALVYAQNISRNEKGILEVFGITYAQNVNLCPGERFESQPVVAFCSGVLIDADLVLTAGHCLSNLAMCRLTHFVFNASYSTPQANTPAQRLDIADSDVYTCEELIHTQEGHFDEIKADFAIVRLDRPVKGHTPAILALDQKGLKIGQDMRAAGYPAGVPMKLVEGQVRTNDPAMPFFVTNLDTFHRNSGSPVFDATSGKLQGIVVDGEDDFDMVNGCNRVRHCTNDGCRGESATKISEILPFLNEAK